MDPVAGMAEARPPGEGEAQSPADQVYSDCMAILTSHEETAAGEDKNRQHVWKACILLLAKTFFNTGLGAPERSSSSRTLSQICKEAGTNLVEVFRELHVVLPKLRPYLESRLGPDRDFEGELRLKEWQTSLVFLTILSKKYKDLYSRFCLLSGVSKKAGEQVGWLLFLLLKMELLPRFPDLVSCVELLVCTTNFICATYPYTPEEVQQLKAENPQGCLPSGKYSTWKVLADAAKADPAKIHSSMMAVDLALVQLLGALPVPLECLEEHPASSLVDTACHYYPTLFSKADHLQRCGNALHDAYLIKYEQLGEIDEREFLTTDFGALASPRGIASQLPSAFQLFETGLRAGGPSRPPLPLQSFGRPPIPGGSGGGSGISSALSEGLRSPLPLMSLGPVTPGTPISTTMGAVHWLRATIANVQAEPSPIVRCFMEECGPGAVRDIQERAERLSQVAMPDTPANNFPLFQPLVTAERRTETLKLYYRMLEAILLHEQKHMGAKNFQSLLMSNTFHMSLMACCAELVAATYHIISLAFPTIPDRLKLKPFDLCKIIDPFVKAGPNLPKELKKHLFVIEEKIVEQVGWQSGSSLYPALVAATTPATSFKGTKGTRGKSPSTSAARGTSQGGEPRPPGGPGSSDVAGGRQRMEVEAGRHEEGGESLSDVDSYSDAQGRRKLRRVSEPEMQPGPLVGPSRGPSPSPSAPTSPSSQDVSWSQSAPHHSKSGPSQERDTAIQPDALPACLGLPNQVRGDLSTYGMVHNFFRKVLKLAAFRLYFLSEGLEFHPKDRNEVVTSVYDVIEYAMYHHTQLFYNRHLDQILLSSLYGYCKVHKLNNVSFREIINQYKQRLQGKQETFRSVPLVQTDPGLRVTSTGDVIAFYNQVFVPCMKAFLLQPTRQGQLALPRLSPGDKFTRGAQVPPASSPLHLASLSGPLPIYMQPSGTLPISGVPLQQGEPGTLYVRGQGFPADQGPLMGPPLSTSGPYPSMSSEAMTAGTLVVHWPLIQEALPASPAAAPPHLSLPQSTGYTAVITSLPISGRLYPHAAHIESSQPHPYMAYPQDAIVPAAMTSQPDLQYLYRSYPAPAMTSQPPLPAEAQPDQERPHATQLNQGIPHPGTYYSSSGLPPSGPPLSTSMPIGARQYLQGAQGVVMGGNMPSGLMSLLQGVRAHMPGRDLVGPPPVNLAPYRGPQVINGASGSRTGSGMGEGTDVTGGDGEPEEEEEEEEEEAAEEEEEEEEQVGEFGGVEERMAPPRE